MVGFRGRVWSRAFKQVDLVEVRHLDETRTELLICAVEGTRHLFRDPQGQPPF